MSGTIPLVGVRLWSLIGEDSARGLIILAPEMEGGAWREKMSGQPYERIAVPSAPEDPDSWVPPELLKRIETSVARSLELGIRRRNVFICISLLAVTLGCLVGAKVSEIILLAVILCVSSACVVWALMSASASINAHLDGIWTILMYYGERSR